MPRDNQYNRGQDRNSNNYERESNRSRPYNRNERERDMDNDFEGSRYESDRYEDMNSNYTDNYSARGGRQMSGSRDRDSQGTDWRDPSQSWNRATDISDNHEESSSRGERGSSNRNSDRDKNRDRDLYTQHDENFSASGEMRHLQRGDYSQPRGRSAQGRGQYSQRDRGYSQGGGDYYEQNNADTSSGGGYGLGRDQYSQSEPIRDPYSRGGRVYSQGRDQDMESDRDSRGDIRSQRGGYSMDGEDRASWEDYRPSQSRNSSQRESSRSARNRDNYDREEYSSRSSHPRYQVESDRNESRSYGGAYSNSEFGTDRGQDLQGSGRYGSKGSYGTRKSNNNYLDESDDNYKYAYGSDNEEKRSSRHASGVDSENVDERSVMAGRARFGHGSEIGDDMGSTKSNRTEKNKKNSSKAKSAKDANKKMASAKSKTAKDSSKGHSKSVESTARTSQLVQ